MAELPDMVRGLMQPQAYPEPTKRVRLEQTQMSFVFLTDNFAYKVKKPVDLGYLDYSTIEKRLHFCNKEVELNRRLCENTYLEVVDITRRQKAFSVNGDGETVDYAVKMRRLPRKRMMDVLLENEGISGEMIGRLAQKIAAFHGQAATNDEISAFGNIDSINRNNDENFSQTQDYIGRTISQKQFRQLAEYSRSFIIENSSLFENRVKEGYIRDCHGDLHTAHICFENGICIYDCIEFNERFRYGDTASEVAFLAMDLDHHGRADLSHNFIDKYIGFSGDEGLKKLLTFYKCYRAYVRGKVACFKLDDPYITADERDKAFQDAVGYFDLSYAYVKLPKTLFITTGLVGSGKSAISRALAKRLGLAVMSSDVTRKKLANIWVKERRFEDFNSGIYSPEFSRKTYDAMFSKAKGILGAGGSAIIDASFIKAEEREKAKSLAEETGARFFILECKLEEELTRQRLSQRLRQGSISDGRWEIYRMQKAIYPAIDEAIFRNRVIIDNYNPISDNIRKVIDTIY
jgi:aminoglycoside phosphotransferase family enzyme/gluconate kinase